MASVIYAIITFIVLVPIITMNSAYPLTVIWNWFIPTLGGPTITMTMAMGICIIVGFFKSHEYYKDHETDTTKAVIHTIFSPWISLFMAWIVLQFVEAPSSHIKLENGQGAVPAHVAVEQIPSELYRQYLADKERIEAKYLQFLLDEEGKNKVK